MLPRSAFAVFLLALGAASFLSAQNPTASLVGTVVDATGATVQDAKLEVRNTETGETRRLATAVKGEFAVTNLPPGAYEVTVSKEGFRTVRQAGVELQMEQAARLEFRLEVGATTQAIEVAGSIPLINTENPVKGEVMVTREIVEMPLDGRDISDLAYLTPGVTPAPSGGTGSPFNINGARTDNTNFILDGFNDQSARASSIKVAPSLEAIEEFKMQTTGYSAEYGRLAGGVMNMVLKTGTNQPHGSLFEFLRNDVFDARNTFSADKPPLRRNQFGGSLSGPIRIPKLYDGTNRTFFLFSWESYRQRVGDVQLSIVPTAAQREGDFSAFAPLKDPLLTGTCSGASRAACFPGNQIPKSRMSPISLAAMQFYPLPNRPGQVNNYIAVASDKADRDQAIIKIDHRFNDNNSISARWLKSYSDTTFPYGGGSALGTFGYSQDNPQTLTGLSYTRLFTPVLVNEARVGFSRTYVGQVGYNAGIDYNAQFGLPGPKDPALIGFPKFVVTNYAQLGDNAALPVQFTVNNFQYTDTLSWVKGPHLFKFGFDALRTQFFQPFFNNNRGTYNFNGKWTNDAFADFLIGELNQTTRQVGTEPNYLFSSNYSGFAQDDWRVSSRLTVNLGVRYELMTPPVEKYGRMTNFLPEYGVLALSDDKTLQGSNVTFTDPSKVGTAAQLGLPKALVYTRYNNLAPRLGFAWRPFGGNKTVVRSGYGIYYGSAMQNPVRQQLANVFPFTVSQTFNRNANNPAFLTIANPFPTAAVLAGSVNNVAGYELHAKTPSQQSWNFTIEREIGGQAAVEIGYVGSKGSHLGRSYDLNQPIRTAAATILPYPAFGTMNYFGFNANSSYNAATVTFRRRFARGFFYRVSYNYAKSIDDASQLSGNADGDISAPQNVRNLHQDRGRSSWDVGHSFTMAFSYEMPRSQNLLIRGWQIAGTGRASTGQPFTPQISGANLALGEASRPDRIAKGDVPEPSPERWFDLSAFPPVPDGAFRFGNSGRNILDGPGLLSINTSLSRNFQLVERARLQFRWEIFNLFNRANYGMPNVNVNAPNGGTITSARDARLMQFALRLSF
jgi:outer membrane receptor protein involved in Fe transport